MYHNGEDISAYLDGELASEAAAELERELETDPYARAELDRLRTVDQLLGSESLSGEEGPDFESSRERTWMALEHRLGLRQPLWKRRVTLPYPAVAAAAVAVFVLVGLLLWFGGPQLGNAPSVAGTSVRDVDVHIAAGGTEGEKLLRWLNEQEVVGAASVELPDVAQFRIMGEPRLIKAAEFRSRGE